MEIDAQTEYNDKPFTLLPPFETAKESERAVGIHYHGLICDKDEDCYPANAPDWEIHWANVHASAAFYTLNYIRLKIENDELREKLKALPTMPKVWVAKQWK